MHSEFQLHGLGPKECRRNTTKGVGFSCLHLSTAAPQLHPSQALRRGWEDEVGRMLGKSSHIFYHTQMAQASVSAIVLRIQSHVSSS